MRYASYADATGIWSRSVQIDLARSLAAPPALIFATVADIMSWPQIIGSVTRVGLLTPGAIGVGTRRGLGGVPFWGRDDRGTGDRDDGSPASVAPRRRGSRHALRARSHGRRRLWRRLPPDA